MLEVKDLRFGYDSGSGEELFGGLSHQFSSHGVTAVTGPSGRGKSTLLYVMGLMLRPSGGSVVINGRPASNLPDHARSALRARQIGFVFQDSVLDPSRKILDAVVEPALYAGVPRAQVTGRARRLLEDLGVAHRADHRPGQISGGQAQRVAVCRALINDPPAVLADEPTGNLDPDNALGVLSALRGYAGSGRTVVIATHDPFVISHADDVLRL